MPASLCQDLDDRRAPAAAGLDLTGLRWNSAPMQINATPNAFPLAGRFQVSETALIVIDMQRDFCDPDGYIASRGDSVTAARAIIPAIARLLQSARKAGMMVVHTREGHRPDLSDLPEAKRRKTALSGAEIGSAGPCGRLLVRGEPGWQIIPELTPLDGETVIDKPGTGAFHATDLDHILRLRGIRALVLCGVTTAICVNSIAREATDRGFEVLVLEDACAEPDPAMHEMALAVLRNEGGYLASTAPSAAVCAALDSTVPDATA